MVSYFLSLPPRRLIEFYLFMSVPYYYFSSCVVPFILLLITYYHVGLILFLLSIPRTKASLDLNFEIWREGSKIQNTGKEFQF